jgi:uncharacterized MAPEG superfamily protein
MESIDFLIQSYAICVALLYVLYFVTQMLAADPNSHPKEDAQLLKKEIEHMAKIADDETAQEQVHRNVQSCELKLRNLLYARWNFLTQVARKRRYFVNNHENIPIDIAVMTGAMVVAMAKAAEEKFSLLGTFFILYTVFRFLWLICYQLKINQPVPFRSLFFVFSKLLMIALVIITVIVSISKEKDD